MCLVTVVIPIYKPIPDKNELISFNQCLNVLSKHPICILTFRLLDISYYEAILNNETVNYQIVFFDNSFFESVDGYNRLLLSLDFYKRFIDYKYMLIYQLDAYVFRDELEYWCGQGYDYIGAPWFEGWHEALPNAPIIGVGNGGFSLRRIKSIIRLLKVADLYISINDFLKKNKLFGINIPKRIINYFDIVRPESQNEDFYIFNLSTHFKWFIIAPTSDACKFSFDVNPETLYKENDNNLPFGCHAWQRYGLEFWNQFINN